MMGTMMPVDTEQGQQLRRHVAALVALECDSTVALDGKE
jgi:hypothetical protein